MRILLMNQFFWPDSAATSQLLGDLAIELAARGHQVDVICAEGNYAAAGTATADQDQQPAVAIHRVKALPFSRGKLGRVLSYLSFYLGAAWRGLTLPRPELVLTLTTPPLLSLLGTLIRELRGARHFIWEMDVYPDVAISLGYFAAGGVLDRSVGLLADFSRRRADGILALGECMKDRLAARGIAREKIFVAENWADGAAIQPIERPGLKEGSAEAAQLVVLYSGNLGLAHDIDTIGAAMAALKQSTQFSFIFTGGGPRRKELQAFCQREAIASAEFRPYVQRMSLGESLGAGDIGLVTQQDGCSGAVVPSKVYGLLAAARPILFIGPGDATPARIIRQHGCGWHIACGDSDALTSLLLELASNPAEVREAGRRARKVLLEHYDRPIGVARICALLGAGSLHQAEQTESTEPREEAGQQPYRLRSLHETGI